MRESVSGLYDTIAASRVAKSPVATSGRSLDWWNTQRPGRDKLRWLEHHSSRGDLQNPVDVIEVNNAGLEDVYPRAAVASWCAACVHPLDMTVVYDPRNCRREHRSDGSV